MILFAKLRPLKPPGGVSSFYLYDATMHATSVIFCIASRYLTKGKECVAISTSFKNDRKI